jgi:alpha-tubulin suppressor-like RCC1 family protein
MKGSRKDRERIAIHALPAAVYLAMVLPMNGHAVQTRASRPRLRRLAVVGMAAALGVAGTVHAQTPTPIRVNPGPPVVAPTPHTVQVDFNNSVVDPTVPYGHGHACAVSSAGTVKCWGSGFGIGGGAPNPLGPAAPRLVAIGNVKAVAAGDDFSCALRNDGTIACWGQNDHYQLGSPGPATGTPVEVPSVTNAVEIDAGEHHACAVLSTHYVVCWGDDSLGQLGLRNFSAPQYAQLLPGIDDALHVAATANSTCIVAGDTHETARNRVVCWGSNQLGELGIGTIDQTSQGRVAIPTVVPGLSGVDQIAAHTFFVCARAGGRVACWGNGSNNESQWVINHDPGWQIGGTVPQWVSDGYAGQLSVTHSFSDIAVGAVHACGIIRAIPSTDGTIPAHSGILCWGMQRSRQLGGDPADGYNVMQEPSVDFSVADTFEHVFAGAYDTCATVWMAFHPAPGSPEHVLHPPPPTPHLWCWGDRTFDLTGTLYAPTHYTTGPSNVPLGRYTLGPMEAMDLQW